MLPAPKHAYKYEHNIQTWQYLGPANNVDTCHYSGPINRTQACFKAALIFRRQHFSQAAIYLLSTELRPLRLCH